MKRSTKLIVTFILLATLCLTAALMLGGCGIIMLIGMSEQYVDVDGVRYELNSNRNEAKALYFYADKTLADGEKQVCVVRDKITSRGTEYTVTAIGDYFEKGRDIIEGNAQIGELVVPTTVSRITLNYYTGLDTLESINVSNFNPCYYSKDGVLFERTSYGLYLIYYPLGKTDDTFEFPAKLGNIYESSHIWENERLQSLEIEAGSSKYVSFNSALYSADGEALMLYPLHRTASTFVAHKNMRRIDLNSNFWQNGNVTKVDVEEDSKYLKAEGNALYSIDGSELVFRPNDGRPYFAIPSTVKVVSYNALRGISYLYVPSSVAVFLDTFVEGGFDLTSINRIYFESEYLPKYLRSVEFSIQQVRFGYSLDSFDELTGNL